MGKSYDLSLLLPGGKAPMDVRQVEQVLSTSFSMRPGDVLSKAAGRFLSLVEFGCLRSILGQNDRSSRRERKLEFRFDPEQDRYWATSLKSQITIPRSSLRFDDAGRLEHFEYDVGPLDEMVCEFSSAVADGWRAIGYQYWSNTPIMFSAANARMWQEVPRPESRGTVDLLQDAGTFWIGDDAYAFTALACTFRSGAKLMEFYARGFHRDTAALGPARIELHVAAGVVVELLPTHLIACSHPNELKLK